MGSISWPPSLWVTQQARNLFLGAGERVSARRFLICDRDTKFNGSFDEVFRGEGIRVIRTPVRSSKANAFAKRWIGTLRRECLDWMLIFGRGHLESVLREYIEHYNEHRPHRSLDLRAPETVSTPVEPVSFTSSRQVRRRDRLGELLHEYTLAA